MVELRRAQAFRRAQALRRAHAVCLVAGSGGDASARKKREREKAKRGLLKVAAQHSLAVHRGGAGPQARIEIPFKASERAPTRSAMASAPRIEAPLDAGPAKQAQPRAMAPPESTELANTVVGGAAPGRADAPNVSSP